MVEQARSSPPPAEGSSRLLSLDVFRGITIAGMILVNNPGTWSAIYPPLKHAEWHGWTPTDLIFPFFLFIVGVAMVFSLRGRLERGATRGQLFRHVLVRSLLLFALGMILTGLPEYNFYQKLILDVLQRIAVVYLLSAAIVLVTQRAGQIILAVVCLVSYWLLMAFVPVPGHGSGVLDQDGNVWQYVDTILLQGWHDHPEGILSLVPSVSTVLLGVLTGEWLRSERPALEKLVGLFIAGNLGLVIGLIMDAFFPINKLLWSSSYVVFTAGFALNLLGMCFWTIEIKRWTAWSKPFLVFGRNAIATFFLASFVARAMGLIEITAGPGGTMGLKSILYKTLFASWLGDINASLLYALTYTAVWLGIMTIFYKKKIFIKL